MAAGDAKRRRRRLVAREVTEPTAETDRLETGVAWLQSASVVVDPVVDDVVS